LGKGNGSKDLDTDRADLFGEISHPMRIRILDALERKPMGFAELGRAVGIESGGHLSFHLTKLGHLIQTDSRGDYTLTVEGKEALWLVHGPREMPPAWEVAKNRAHRIAVLPFTNMSPDPDGEYLAEGMTEEIISTVSGISGLEVISRTSVMGYKGTNKRIEEIGRELKVGSVLEGSFRKVARRIRVTVQLIDVSGDKHLWGQNYDRNLGDILSVQSEVARKVANALRVKIASPEAKRIERGPTKSATAYTLYLKGKYFWNKRGIDDVRRALEYFELAVHEDPDYAMGFACISDCCRVLRSNWGVEPEANLERAKKEADRALELDPELAEAHTSKAALLSDEYDLRQAEREFRRAIELKPSYAEAHQWYYNLLVRQGRWVEALEQIEKAVKLGPLSPMIHANHGDYYVFSRDYGRAIGPYRKAVELGFGHARRTMAWAYGMMKQFDDMKREYEAYVNLNENSNPLAKLKADVNAAYLMGDKESVRRRLPELEALFHDGKGPSAYFIGAFQLFLGEKDKGFEWMELSYSKREHDLMDIKNDPELDGVRTDPRYLALVKRLGLERAWKSNHPMPSPHNA